MERLDIIAFLRAAGLEGARSGSGVPPFSPLLPVVDVRSPCEFVQGHIPGAVNFPLFSDAERADVGTLYKQQGREAAMLRGLGHVGPRMAAMADQALELAGPRKELALYCSRGGMRSESVAWLCSVMGIRARVLKGGYKVFRRHVLSVLEQPFPLFVLGGKTGSGKTEALHDMAGLGAQVIDLEGLARHRGSAFGAFPDEPQPSNEHFENRLATALGQCNPAQPVWVEDECENLGRDNLPRIFFAALRMSPLFVLEVPDEERLARVLKEYGAQSRVEMGECLDRIRKRLGGLEHKRAHAYLAEGDLRGLALILLGYYDRAYTKQLERRPLRAVITTADAGERAARVLEAASPFFGCMTGCKNEA